MNNVYLVKSGRLIDFVGWEWLNLKVFSDYDKAMAYYKQVLKQIPECEYQKTEDVDIEILTLE